MTEAVLMTQQGYDDLVKRRDELVLVKRRENQEKLKEARSYGDLSENAEYDAAKNEQAETEAEIVKIEYQIRNAKIVSASELKCDVVNVGLKVKIKDVDTGKSMNYAIVGPTEADPFGDPPSISNESKVGGALIGRKKGETVEIAVPDRILHYKIESIRRK